MGAERELVLCISLFAFIVGVGGMKIASAVTALGFYTAGLLVARRMAKADPAMLRVWLRHIKQQTFYPAKSGIWRR